MSFRSAGIKSVSTRKLESFVYLVLILSKGSARGFVDRSKDLASRGASSVSHSIQPPVVWLDETRTRGAVIFGAVVMSRSNVTDDQGAVIEVDTQSHTRLFYTTIKENNSWRIRSMVCTYYKDSMEPTIPGQVLVVKPKTVRWNMPLS